MNQAGLERLLENGIPVEQRAAAYMRLLEIFAANGSMDQVFDHNINFYLLEVSPSLCLRLFS